MKNVVWHCIWLPQMCSRWPSVLMKLFKVPAARHYWHSLNTWDRLEVCNKLCCAGLLRTKLMCRDFTFQHHSVLGFGIKHSTVLMTLLPERVFASLFPFCEWSVYLSSICHLGHLIIISSQPRAGDLTVTCDKCQVIIRNKYSVVYVLSDCAFLCGWISV